MDDVIAAFAGLAGAVALLWWSYPVLFPSVLAVALAAAAAYTWHDARRRRTRKKSSGGNFPV